MPPKLPNAVGGAACRFPAKTISPRKEPSYELEMVWEEVNWWNIKCSKFQLLGRKKLPSIQNVEALGKLFEAWRSSHEYG